MSLAGLPVSGGLTSKKNLIGHPRPLPDVFKVDIPDSSLFLAPQRRWSLLQLHILREVGAEYDGMSSQGRQITIAQDLSALFINTSSC